MPEGKQGLVIVYTGNGKGKTTAAFGMAFRAQGRGFKVGIVQFIKGKWLTGERKFADSLEGIDIEVMGKGFTWESKDINQDKLAAQQAWSQSKEMILSKRYQIVILDEITYAMNYGFIDADDVYHTLAHKPPKLTIVLTGRNAPPELIDLADLVSEMKMIKHPYTEGQQALIGIDY